MQDQSRNTERIGTAKYAKYAKKMRIQNKESKLATSLQRLLPTHCLKKGGGGSEFEAVVHLHSPCIRIFFHRFRVFRGYSCYRICMIAVNKFQVSLSEEGGRCLMAS